MIENNWKTVFPRSGKGGEVAKMSFCCIIAERKKKETRSLPNPPPPSPPPHESPKFTFSRIDAIGRQ